MCVPRAVEPTEHIRININTRMKNLAVFCLLVALSLVEASTKEEKYTTKYDYIDVDEIINNERLLMNYHKCLMEKGKCSPEGAELKKNIPDAMKTDCSKCSEKQKAGSEKVIKFLIDNRPELWKPLEEKYDPEGTYRKRYKQFGTIRKENIASEM